MPLTLYPVSYTPAQYDIAPYQLIGNTYLTSIHRQSIQNYYYYYYVQQMSDVKYGVYAYVCMYVGDYKHAVPLHFNYFICIILIKKK